MNFLLFLGHRSPNLSRFGHASNFASLFTKLMMCAVDSSEKCPEGFFCGQFLLQNS
jgi:hypothetical protein